MQADAAKRASETAKASAEQLSAGLTTLNTTLQGLNEQAKGIELQFKFVTDQINAASENANLRSQRDFNAVQRRITALEGLVREIGEDSAASRKATAEYARQIAALETKFDSEQKRFAENSAYTVPIFYDPSKKSQATEVQSRLASLGFPAKSAASVLNFG
jgi:predicted  nucleic acid-binding Zn-ribbon protein